MEGNEHPKPHIFLGAGVLNFAFEAADCVTINSTKTTVLRYWVTRFRKALACLKVQTFSLILLCPGLRFGNKN